MKYLYCGRCGEYLEGGDGECYDCHCGWKQSQENSSTNFERIDFGLVTSDLEHTHSDREHLLLYSESKEDSITVSKKYKIKN